MKKNFNFLKEYQKLQFGIMYDEIIELNSLKICFNSNDPSVYWNNVFIDRNLNNSELEKIEQLFAKKDREATFYFENSNSNKNLKSFLENKNYKKTFEDSWMFFEEGKIDKSKFEQVKKVETRDQLNIFLETFNKSYQKDDPQNVYGELGEYLGEAEKAWIKYHGNNKIEYFIVFDNNNNPVAVSSLTNDNKLGYISNVGSLKSVRGKGYGKLATLYCVHK